MASSFWLAMANAYHGESLGDKGTSYRQWTEHFEQYCANHAEEASYWRDRMADYAPLRCRLRARWHAAASRYQ